MEDYTAFFDYYSIKLIWKSSELLIQMIIIKFKP